MTTAHAHKSGVNFHLFSRAFKQKKIKALRPKMTKIASRGGVPALTTHWHGMTTFPMYTARARGCCESCGVLMVTFPSCAWKESTKLAIRSRMEYACAVWSGGSTRSLQRLQDSFAKQLGLTLPPLKIRFNYHTLVLFYKIVVNTSKLSPKILVFTSPRSFFHNIRLFNSKIFLPCPPHKKVSNLGKFFTPHYCLMEWPSH